MGDKLTLTSLKFAKGVRTGEPADEAEIVSELKPTPARPWIKKREESTRKPTPSSLKKRFLKQKKREGKKFSVGQGSLAKKSHLGRCSRTEHLRARALSRSHGPRPGSFCKRAKKKESGQKQGVSKKDRHDRWGLTVNVTLGRKNIQAGELSVE